MTQEEYLKNCTDDELFKLIFKLNTEIVERLISLFKSKGCTAVEISKNAGVEANVNDMFGSHKWPNDEIYDKWVKVEEIGYATMLDEEHAPFDYIYVVTDNSEVYSHDEINEHCLWDLYAAAKEAFEND